MTAEESALRQEYTSRSSAILEPLATSVERHLMEHLRGQPRVDSIRARAKSADRFMAKAAKLNADRTAKYSDPLNQIQDQVGARIVVFYLGDVERICNDIVRRYFRSIEDRAIVPDSPKEFDYEGQHFILFVPSDLIRSGWTKGTYPTFFELQIKTLFQHSWAEANHDLAYKAPADLTVDQRRMVAFSAAQAWGADRMFQDLASELKVFEAGDPSA